MERPSRLKTLYTGTLLTLAFLALVIVILECTVTLTPKQHHLLEWTGRIIISVFILEFLIGLTLAKDKKAYFKENWISLLAILSSLKFLKAIKATKILKGAKVAKVGKLTNKFRSLLVIKKKPGE